jgi:NAD(P)-dependent dehydrogenase (short-subunit alcohol dehydrogenase family)
MGRASALACAREGASIVACDLDVDAAQATVESARGAAGEMASIHPCHLTDPADCQALIELAIGTFGRVDVLFNLAATAYFNWLEDITGEEWDRARRNEVDLVFYLTRAARSHLKASSGMVASEGQRRRGREYGVGERVARRQGRPLLAHATNKAGIIAMTRQLAMEGREHGIGVNSISPALIETNASRDQPKDREWAGFVLGKTLLVGWAGRTRSRTPRCSEPRTRVRT